LVFRTSINDKKKRKGRKKMNKDINNFINNSKEEILSVLEEVVNMDSVTEYKEGVNAVGNFLGHKFLEIGLKVEKVPQEKYGDHVICRLKGEGDNTLVVGHFDTALPKGSPKKRPFKIIGNRAYGCGIADMKGGIIVALYAIKSILKTTETRPNITVFLNSDEENGSTTSLEKILIEASKASRVFIMEPGENGSIITRRKGIGVFTFKTKGAAAHAGAEPEKGCNAIVELAHMILDLSRLNDYERGITVNVGEIEGGTYTYVVPEEATTKVDFRIPTEEDGVYLKNRFNEITNISQAKGVKRSWKGDFHRKPMKKSTELFEFVNEIGSELRIPIKDGSTGSCSDGNSTSAMGIPTLDGMGPVGAGFHGPKEYVEIDSIFDRTKLLAQTLYKIYNI
jgi:glutamate carboxypeptidase